jgi:hypothetical protein
MPVHTLADAAIAFQLKLNQHKDGTHVLQQSSCSLTGFMSGLLSKIQPTFNSEGMLLAQQTDSHMVMMQEVKRAAEVTIPGQHRSSCHVALKKSMHTCDLAHGFLRATATAIALLLLGQRHTQLQCLVL